MTFLSAMYRISCSRDRGNHQKGMEMVYSIRSPDPSGTSSLEQTDLDYIQDLLGFEYPKDPECDLTRCYSDAKAAISSASCSLLRLEAISSKSMPFSSAATLSMTASLLSRNNAEVSSVTCWRVFLMKSSSMP